MKPRNEERVGRAAERSAESGDLKGAPFMWTGQERRVWGDRSGRLKFYEDVGP